jgi:hypothetical protein
VKTNTFSKWLLESLQKDFSEHPELQKLVEEIKRNLPEGSQPLNRPKSSQPQNEVIHSKQTFEIAWNQGIHNLNTIENMHFRTIPASLGNQDWGERCYVEGRIIWDTWLSLPNRVSWIQSCHSFLEKIQEAQNLVWMIDFSGLESSHQSEIKLLAPCLHPISEKLNSVWCVGSSTFFPPSSKWWGVPFFQALEIEKPFNSIGLLAPPEANSRWARRKRHWKRILNGWNRDQPEFAINQHSQNWHEPKFNWEDFQLKEQFIILQDLLCWLKPH